MTQEHPITPPPELVIEWWNECTATSDNLIGQLATQAARWGADQEFEVCCDLIEHDPCCGTKFQRRILVRKLREVRRPKPVIRDDSDEPTDKQLQETFLDGYYKSKDRQGPNAQAAGLRAVLERWGN